MTESATTGPATTGPAMTGPAMTGPAESPGSSAAPREVVDWHSHVWLPEHLGPQWGPRLDAHHADAPPSRLGSHEHHRAAMAEAGVTAAVVLALVSRRIGMEVPNDYVAEYAETSDRLVGVGSVDPNDPGAVAEVARIARLGLRGVKLSPPYQGFHPHSDEAFAVYRAAADHGLFLMFHQGSVFIPECPIDYAQPILLDRVARAFPGTRMILCHAGQPWIAETLALIHRHDNLYADVSARTHRPWQLHSIVQGARETSAVRKLLWGSDFPTFGMAASLDALRAASTPREGAPALPERLIDEIVHDRPLALITGDAARPRTEDG